MKTHFETREDGSEIIEYNYDDFFAYVHSGRLSWFPNYTTNNHWHDDLEFLFILSGSMTYNVNGTVVCIEAGQGLIVNSRRFHYGFSTDNADCEFLCILLHPMLLCASPRLEVSFVMPFLSLDAPSYFLLHSEVPWENKILVNIRKIYKCRHDQTAPLRIQGLFYRIWLVLYENVFQKQKVSKPPEKRVQKLTLLKDMILYIEKNYREKITLEDIAKAGFLSKSGCLALFKRYMNETPIRYLIKYRLKIGANLLCSTGSSVTEIAYLVGFSNASYFAECFHKFYECAPLEYRKTHAVSESHRQPIS